MLASSTSFVGKGSTQPYPHHSDYSPSINNLNMNAWQRDYAFAPRDAHRGGGGNVMSAAMVTMPPGSTGVPAWDETDQMATGVGSTFGDGAAENRQDGSGVATNNNGAGFSYSSADYYRPTGSNYANQMASMSKFYSGGSPYGPTPTSNAPFASLSGSFAEGSTQQPQQHYGMPPSGGGSMDRNAMTASVLEDHHQHQPQHHNHNPPPHPHHHHHQHHQHSHMGSSHQHGHPAPVTSDFSDFRSQYMNPFEVKHRRRTTRTQFKILESTFKENAKPNAATRKNLSQQLDMPIRAVQIWFQNRRAKAKAIAKREAATTGGSHITNVSSSHDQDRSRRQHQFLHQSGSNTPTSKPSSIMMGGMDEMDGDAHRYSSSSVHSVRPQTAGAETGMGFNAMSISTPSSSSSSFHADQFKVPNRPYKVESDGSTRRMTIGALPSSSGSSNSVGSYATTGGANYYNSPPLSAAFAYPPPGSSQMSTTSSSAYDAYSRPTSSSTSATNTSYDDRYRRGLMTSPSSIQQESPQGTFANTVYRGNNQQAAGLESQQLPSPLDLNSKRSTLSDGLSAANTFEATSMQQAQDPRGNGGSGGNDMAGQTNYWRY